MTNFPRSFEIDRVGGYVYVAKDNPDVIRDAVVELLIRKFPDGLSEDEIHKFVQNCRSAISATNAALCSPK